MAEPVVELVNVTVAYEGEKVAAVHDLDLTVAAGELVAIVGPNGAGKTTVLEAAAGLLPVNRGAVRVFGQRMGRGAHLLRRRLAYLPQDMFFPADTPFLVRDVVLLARAPRFAPFRPPGRDDRRAVDEALTAVGMAWAARRPIGRLSGGQQRKVLMARALATRAELLLLDEPMSNLDPAAKEDLGRLVVEVVGHLGASAIVVSHESGVLLDEADRIVTMIAGRIVGECAERAAVGGRA